MSHLKIIFKLWLYGIKSSLPGQGMVVVLTSASEESHRVIVIISWLTCQIVFVFQKCLVSCNNYWCCPSITV